MSKKVDIIERIKRDLSDIYQYCIWMSKKVRRIEQSTEQIYQQLISSVPQ